MTKHAVLTSVLLLGLALVSQTTQAECRYEQLNGLKGSAIRTKLHELISDHYVLSYDAARADRANVDIVNNKVVDMYSNCSFGTKDYCGSGDDYEACDCYNREHALPKSFWGGSKDEPMYTDLHHIIPTDFEANTTRSAWAYGEPASVTWTNGKSKAGTGGTYGSLSSNIGEVIFEPADDVKGDIARIYFYMLTCYMDKKFNEGGKGYRMFTWASSSCNLTYNAKELLLKWHRNDPVSDREKDRNNRVENKQGNRNPFVDEPDLVEYIWGNKTNVTYQCSSAALDEVSATNQSLYTKKMINGQIVIEIDGVAYNTLGQRIK